ncbi:hypothetical protein Tco_1089468, partial [Tanacetum coccineum]
DEDEEGTSISEAKTSSSFVSYTSVTHVWWSRDVEWETCGQNSDFGRTHMAEKLYTESTDGSSI